MLFAMAVIAAGLTGSWSMRAAEAETPLKSIEEIRGVSAWDLRQSHPVRLTGTLTFIDREQQRIVIQESTGAALALKVEGGDPGVPVGRTIVVEAADSWPHLESQPEFPLRPSGQEKLTSAKIPVGRGANYISRLRGYLHPPVSGEYRFVIASDDTSELWLGVDDDYRSARRIAAATTWTRPEEWTRRSSQRSAAIYLEAGRRYYLEAVHEQRLGGDHLSVGWEGPGLTRQVIAGEFLSPWEPLPAGRSRPEPEANLPRGSILREYWLERTVENAAALTAQRRLESTLVLVDARISEIAAAPQPVPARVKPGQTCGVREDFRWCEMEGNVEFVAQRGDSLVLELSDGTPRTRVIVKGAPLAWARRYDRRRIRVSGVAEPATDGGGHRVIGTIWTNAGTPPAIVEEWPLLNTYQSSTISEVLTVDPQIFRNRPVRVRGQVVEADGKGQLTLRDCGAFYSYTSSDGATWKLLAGPVEVTMRETVHVGLMVASRAPGQSVTTTFENVRGLDEPMRSGAVGDFAAATGRFLRTGNNFEVTGSGEDVWDGPDDFYFVHRQLAGEGEIVARVGTMGPAPVHEWAKAGLMVRESLAPDAPFADLVTTGRHGIHFQWRDSVEGSGPLAIFDSTLGGVQWLKLERRYHTIQVTTATAASFRPGEMLEVVGYVSKDQVLAAITDASCREFASDRAQPQQPATQEMRPLVEIARMRSAAGYTNLYDQLKVRGVVTFAGQVAGRRYLALQDQSGAVLVSDRFIPEPGRYQPGRLVEVQSNPTWFAPSRVLNATNIFVLGAGVMPKPVQHPAEYSLPHRGEGAWLEVEGIVRAVSPDGLMILKQGADLFTVAVDGVPAEKLRGYIDATLRVRGALVYPVDQERLLLVPSEEQVEVVETAPRDPLALPSQTIAELAPTRFANNSVHRVKLKGVVTLAQNDTIYIEDGSSGARIELAEPLPAKVGDMIEAAGFPDSDDDNSLVLSHSVARVIGSAATLQPASVTTANILSGNFGARLIRLRAVFSRDRIVEGAHTLELQLDQRIFRASLPAASLPTIPAGSVVEITGVCVLETALPDWIKVSAGSSSILPVRLLLRSTEDLVVVSKPRAWAVRRTLITVGMTLTVLLVGAFWIQLLRRRVAQRTAELNATMDKLRRETQSAATFAERNRLAGEIHDSLEQGFSGLILQLDTTAKFEACPPEVRAGLTLARNMVAFSRNEVRHAVWDLQSPVLENSDLSTAVGKIIEHLIPDTVQTTLAVEGRVRPLSSSVDHHLLRIAQEAVTNSIKHAHPAHLDIVLTYAEDEVSLLVRDDGRGFVPDQVLTGGLGHFGLRSLRGRAVKIQGKLAIISKPGEGTTVEIRVPATKPGTTIQPFHANE